MDMQALTALAAVLEYQSFQAAADKLCVTQSAVSQRIKILENHYGEPLLIRTAPYRPTQLGQLLLGYYRRVNLLVASLDEELLRHTSNQTVSVAISRDSMETWFAKVLHHLQDLTSFSLKIISDDQDLTMNYLQNGLVTACTATSAKTLPGCKSVFLGYFDYILVASPEFQTRYFSDKKHMRDALLSAPAILFDAKDHLHAQYLQKFFSISDAPLRYHVIPSVAGFRQFALQGYAYALIPEIDVIQELKNNQLRRLFPEQRWEMPVYWHSWNLETPSYQRFNELVMKVSRKILRQKA